MAKIARFKGFFIFLFQGDTTQRPHVHVARSRAYGQAAKIWMNPEIEIAEHGSLTQKELNEVIRILREHQNEINGQIEKIRKGENVHTLDFN